MNNNSGQHQQNNYLGGQGYGNKGQQYGRGGYNQMSENNNTRESKNEIRISSANIDSNDGEYRYNNK